MTSLPDTPWPEFGALKERHLRLGADHRDSGKKLLELRAELKTAEEQHRQAYAQAIADEKPEPSRKQIEKLETEIEAKVRRLAAIDDALDTLEQELIEAIEQHRQPWEADAATLQAQARKEFGETVAALQEARVNLAERTALVRFLTDFPGPWRPSLGSLRTLITPAGEPTAWETVHQALLADAAPPAPPAAPGQVQHRLAPHQQAVSHAR